MTPFLVSCPYNMMSPWNSPLFSQIKLSSSSSAFSNSVKLWKSMRHLNLLRTTYVRDFAGTHTNLLGDRMHRNSLRIWQLVEFLEEYCCGQVMYSLVSPKSIKLQQTEATNTFDEETSLNFDRFGNATNRFIRNTKYRERYQRNVSLEFQTWNVQLFLLR